MLWLGSAGLLAAQDKHIDGLHFGASGDIGTGYSGDYTPGGSSDHGLGVNGDAYVNGYYFNPNFLSFNTVTSYGRSQANSGAGSLTDSTQYQANVNIFNGSRTPGSISVSQTWNDMQTYGLPGSLNLMTNNNNRSFAVGWSFNFPNLPNVSVGYSNSSGSSSVVGSSSSGTGTTQNYNIHAGYSWWGFPLSFGYNHSETESSNSGLLANAGGKTTEQVFMFTTGRKLPRGYMSFSYSHSSYDSSSSGVDSNGSGNNINATYGTSVWQLPVSLSASYSDNVYASIEQQYTSSNGGAGVAFTSESPKTSTLNVTASTSYSLFRKIFVTGFVLRQQEWEGDSSYGLTQYGVNAAYNFGKRVRGLTVMVGVVDTANQVGNSGASLRSSANYNRRFGHWETNANLEYDQQLATLYSLYTTSSVSYGGSVSRRLPRGFRMAAGAGGGHSGFSAQSGASSQSESANASLGWRSMGLSSSYAKSSGQSVLTSNGLATVTSTAISSNQIVVFNGTSESLAFSGAPFKRASLTLSYSHATGSSSGAVSASDTKTSTYNGYFMYQARKLYFTAGATRYAQSVIGASAGSSNAVSYYFGLSRWFNLF